MEADMKPAGGPESLSIAIVTGSVSHRAGGLYHSVRRSAQALREFGNAIEVLSIRDADTDADMALWNPIFPRVWPRRGPEALGFAIGPGRALRRGTYGIVHQHGIWQALSTQVDGWRRRTGGPVMISPRGMLDPWALQNSRWKKKIAEILFEKSNLRGAACLHALNRSEAESIRGYGLTNPIAIIPNGTDLPAHRDLDAQPPAWWHADDRRVLLFLGRLHPKKGIRELIEAWSLVRYQAPAVASSWRVVLAGWDDGGHESDLRQFVSQKGLERDVLFLGPVHGDKKDLALRRSNAFILPSYSEGLPMSVLEAWAYGLPVFMTDACNLPEGFSEAAAVRLEMDPPILASTLAKNLQRGDLQDYGRSGRRLVEERFDWAKLAAQHDEVYRWMLDGGAPPPCVQTE